MNIGNLNTCNVTNMNRMFMKCYKLKEIDVSHFNTSLVEDMSQMFFGCLELESLDLDEFDTSNVTNMNYMFSNCIKIKSLNIENFDISNVTSMTGMFGAQTMNDISYSMQIEEIKGLNKWNTEKVTSMAAMFQMCPMLYNLDLSSFNTKNIITMDYMFNGCTNLHSINNDEFEIRAISETDNNAMFSGCKNLTANIVIIDVKEPFEYFFNNAATSDGSQITVNYSNKASEIIDGIIATKSSNSNVLKGNLLDN